MIQLLLSLFLTTCVVHAEPNSLAWWLLPNNSEDLPHEIEEDDNGYWTELWIRPYGAPSAAPTTVMEQSLGVRWLGVNPDKEGKPSTAVMIVGGRNIVEFTGETAKFGTVDSDKITWSDGTAQKLLEFKKHGRRRRKKGTNINFGKISLPPLLNKDKDLSTWTVEGLNAFLEKIPTATDTGFSNRDLSSIAQLASPSGSLLNFRYSPKCSLEERRQIERALADEVEPKLTCWMEKNPEAGYKFLAVLMQRPLIECRTQIPSDPGACGTGTLPLVDQFFARAPQITIATQSCENELGNTLLHEIFHLSGLKENDPGFQTSFQQSEACGASPATLSFDEADDDSFYNDFQVETRMFFFRKIRDDATKWNWSEGERSFVLGTICAKMGDRFCARRFFQQAVEDNLQGSVELPEGEEVSWSSLAAFELFDSITEDIQRMHELVKYLHKDPNGILLRRMETGVHRLHELYVARQALETVKNNKGLCTSEITEHILCEDLILLVKTPWFKNP